MVRTQYFCLFGLFLFTHILRAQYCSSGGPTSSLDSGIESVFISGENGSSINYLGCPGTIGLDNQTALSVDLAANTNYTLYVQFGTCGGNYPGEGSVYVDFNQDEIFELSELIGSWAGTPPTAQSQIDFTVPAGTMNGLSRIRIIQAENEIHPIDPCSSFTWGSMTDFSVNFTEGVDCSGYIGDEMGAPRQISTLPFNESYSTSFCYTNQDPVYNSPDIYYQIIVSDYDTEFLNVSLCGSSFDTYLSIQDRDTNVLFVNDDYEFCAPQSELTFPIAGLDTLFIVVQGWGNSHGNYNISVNDATVASSNISEKLVFNISPNPAQDVLKIKLNKEQHVLMKMYNNSGQLIRSEYIQNESEISILSYPRGLYFITLQDENNIIRQKIIIEP